MNMLNGAFEMKQLNGNGRLPEEAPDQADKANACLKVLAPMIETAEFYPANMLSAARGAISMRRAARMIWFRRNCRSEMHIRLLVSW